MGIRSIIDNMRRKSELYKEMEAEDRARTKLEQRKLSSEERALNNILEKKRQEAIKAELAKHYKKEDQDYWKKDVITQPNVFVGHKNLLAQPSVFHNQPNLFVTKKRLFTK